MPLGAAGRRTVCRFCCQQHGRALLINAGNANAFTGAVGAQACAHATAVAGALGCAPETDVSSTGVIGELEAEAIGAAAVRLAEDAAASLEAAAAAIATTDTFAKWAQAEAACSGDRAVSVVGIAGVELIAPDMATMLGMFSSTRRSKPAGCKAF